MSLPTACPDCGHPVAEGQRFCRGCGRETTAAPSPLRASPSALPPPEGKAPFWKGTRLYVAAALLLIFVFFMNVKLPGGRSLADERKRACIGNLRLIEAAVGRYLADRGGGAPTMCDLKTLTVEGYLAAEPLCPANGRYSIRVGMAGPPPPYGPPPGVPGSFRVEARCSIHQAIDDTTSGL